MLKKLTASILIFCQLTTPVVANAGLDNLLNQVFGKVLNSLPNGTTVGGSTNSGGDVLSDFLEKGNKELLVFSDGDPLTYDPGNKAQSETQFQQYQQVRKMVLEKKNLDFEDLVKFSNALRPYISYLENIERLKAGGDITLPPGAAVNINASSFCADPGISAPGTGDTMTIVENDAVVPKKAKKLYKALLQYSLNRPEERAFIQQQIHDIKNIQKAPRFLLGAASPEKKQFFDKVMPNGGKEYDDYVKWAINQADKGNKRETETLEESVDKWKPTNTVKGLDFKAKSLDGEKAVAVKINNNTNSPVKLNLADLSALPNTNTKQRLSLAGINDMYANGELIFDPAHRKLVEALVIDAKEVLGQTATTIGGLSLAVYGTVKPVGSAVVKDLLISAPVAGTAIAAWELYSGRNFFSGKQMSTAEKMLTALNLVPSAGAVAKIVGPKAIPILEKYALANFGTQVAGGIFTAESTEYMQKAIYTDQIMSEVMAQRAQQTLVEVRSDPTTPAAIKKLIPA